MAKRSKPEPKITSEELVAANDKAREDLLALLKPADVLPSKPPGWFTERELRGDQNASTFNTLLSKSMRRGDIERKRAFCLTPDNRLTSQWIYRKVEQK
jgi:hypothetical protein